MLASLSVRRTVLSVAGINERGFYNSNVLLVETEQAMLKAADEVIVVADSSKFGHQSLAHLCPWDAVTYLVVDDGLSLDWRRKIEKTKVRLIIADPVDSSGSVSSGSGANERGAKPA